MEQILEQEQEAHFDKEGPGCREIVFQIMDQKLGEGLQAPTSPPSQVISAEVIGKHRKLKGNDRRNDIFRKIGRPDIETVAENNVGKKPQDKGIDYRAQDIGNEELGEGLQ